MFLYITFTIYFLQNEDWKQMFGSSDSDKFATILTSNKSANDMERSTKQHSVIIHASNPTEIYYMTV